VAPKKTKEQLQKNLIKSIANATSVLVTSKDLTVEGAKLPVQPVILKSDVQAVSAAPAAPAAQTLPPDYEYVNHPKHYNTHPSNVEAIDLCEVLSFNVGSAFKYVMRRDDKLTPIQDLRKAKWYIEREILLFQATWRRFLPSWLHSLILSNPNMSEHHYELADRVRLTEKNTHAKLFYNAVLHSTEVHNYAKQDLPTALRALDSLIKSYEAKQKQKQKQRPKQKPKSRSNSKTKVQPAVTK
jgi:Protein of unknwon function (DUF3310)